MNLFKAWPCEVFSTNAVDLQPRLMVWTLWRRFLINSLKYIRAMTRNLTLQNTLYVQLTTTNKSEFTSEFATHFHSLLHFFYFHPFKEYNRYILSGSLSNG